MTSMNDVNLEAGRVEVEVFGQTEAALATLEQECQEAPDFTDPEGYETGKERLKRITKYRTTLEKERKRIKAPYLDACSVIDGEAKRITGRLVALEEPLKAAKKEVDDREKRQKEERLARLRGKIDHIRAFVGRARHQDSASVAELIEACDAIDTQGDFYELTEEAVKAQRETLDQLGEIYSERLQAEENERARRQAEQEAAAQREAQAIEQRINAIRMAPLDLMGKPAVLVRSKIAEMEYQYPATAQFGDRAHEAEQAHEQALAQLRGMLTQAEQLEAAQAQQETAARRQDEQLARDMAASSPAPAFDDRDAPEPEPIPPEDMADLDDLRNESQGRLDAYREAVHDLMDAGLSLEAAQLTVDAIEDGSIRHLSFTGTTAA